MSDFYEKSGVSLEAGYDVVRRIKKHVKKTERIGVMGNIGGFGGMFDLASLGYKEPILVSGTDGVGTKLLIALKMDKHDTIGQDLVAMCVNDIIALGAQPLFFLDYIAIGHNYPEKIEQIVKGIADGCQLAGCALIGGETAEMPDMYQNNHYDLAGFTVGVAEKSKLIKGEKVDAGDVIIGLKSSGIHSNGFSLVRKIILKENNINLNDYHEKLGMTYGEAILAPTKIYVKQVLSLIKQVNVHGMAHITGGGFDENIPRILKSNQGIKIDLSTFDKPQIFTLLEQLGDIPHREMYNIFNMGIGFVIIVSKEDVDKSIEILKQQGEEACVIGYVTNEEGVVIK